MLPLLRSVLAASLLALSFIGAAQAQSLPDHVIQAYGEPPAIPQGPLSEDLRNAVRTVFEVSVAQANWARDQDAGLYEIVEAGDPRLVWLIADMMRFTWRQEFDDALADAGAKLLGIEYTSIQRWHELTDHLIAWDIPEYPGYLDTKKVIFTRFLPDLDRIFVEGDIDWRHVSWGGVLIDNRAYDTTDETCNCIPAADNPEVATAADTTWLKDDDIVFGITINGESRAYPRRIMEVREMVNDTLGGRDLGIPYCTLCGAAQAYFTDGLAQRPILRTSGLLIRSNKVMYDLNTYSVFDTFLGTAVTGPLAEQGVQLEQASVVTTDWGTWKRQHPDTTVLLERYALGRDPDFRSGRDARGPIFPVGDVDPRLPVHEDVIGVTTASGKPVAFQRSTALLALREGAEIRYENVRLELSAGGIKAVGTDDADLGSHEAFWFAWSQFHPETELWVE